MIWVPFPTFTRGRGQVGVALIHMTAEKVWYSIYYSPFTTVNMEKEKTMDFSYLPEFVR
jgi:hypothetical protein